MSEWVCARAWERRLQLSSHVLRSWKYSGRTKLSLRISSSFCPSLRGIIEDPIDPTASVRMSPLLAASCRSSRIFAATCLEVCAFDCKVLNTSAAVTAPVCGRHES